MAVAELSLRTLLPLSVTLHREIMMMRPGEIACTFYLGCNCAFSATNKWVSYIVKKIKQLHFTRYDFS